MDLMSLLFGNKQPQPAAPAPAPQQFPNAGAAAATVTYPDAQTWLSNYVKAQGDLSRANPRSFMNWVTGNQTKAAEENARLQGPAEFLKMLTAGPTFTTANTAAQTGQLGFGQDLSYINRFRAANGMPPVDPGNIAGTFTGAAPTAKPSLPPDTGAAPPQDATPFAPSAQPPVAVAPLAPPQGTPPGSDMSTLFQRLGDAMPQGMPTGAPSPIAPPAGAAASPNPLDAQRALFGQMAASMSGLPKFAGQLPEINKVINQGVEPGRAVNYGTGAVADVNTGRPLTVGVNEDAANKAGGVAAAQQDEHLRVERELNQQQANLTRGNQANQAGLTKSVDAAKIATENAYKPPVLMRAPDGSILGVTTTQMAEAQTTGALNGYRPLTDEDQKALGEYGVKYAKDQASLPDVRKTQNTIHVMLDQADTFPTGTFGGIKQSAGRVLAGLGVDPGKLGNPAGADVIFKNTMNLAMDRLKSSFGAQREAGFIVEKAMQANPNIETQPEAFKFMLHTMDEEANRQADFLTGQQTFRKDHGTIDGYTEQFDRTNPVAVYANRAMVKTYGAPEGSQFLGRTPQGFAAFRGLDGKKFAVKP